ncbi:class I SAM-dependent methyltransferase [Tautonia plasticadhaerens]|uniref:Putative methyltransferase YcgJ n=1 Tax=Tautonia plasticadhaerens TaxID=2527974 RepID=A0A518H0K1_9BACT|nr:methyltransferase domain-containing protein [Tautonia plasticadhaerens]QDV34364.1 putative methyltransferase YcgJ [Tautonia plasticadhaerens]
MPQVSPPSTDRPPPLGGLLRCLGCRGAVGPCGSCAGCGRSYPERWGIVEAIGPLVGRDRITEAFYGGPAWERFRPWERRFLAIQGGSRRARRPILRHLPGSGSSRLLEVGIGDGDNLEFLPGGWEVVGVDHSGARLDECLRRFPSMAGRLARAQASELPFPDGSFDASLCVGGFTMFEDHERALRELRRVTRLGGPVIVADEQPWLCRMGIGHLIGVPRIDRWWLRGLGLDPEFVEMVFALPRDLRPVFRDVLPGAEWRRIWGGLGYCVVDR